MCEVSTHVWRIASNLLFISLSRDPKRASNYVQAHAYPTQGMIAVPHKPCLLCPDPIGPYEAILRVIVFHPIKASTSTHTPSSLPPNGPPFHLFPLGSYTSPLTPLFHSFHSLEHCVAGLVSLTFPWSTHNFSFTFISLIHRSDVTKSSSCWARSASQS